METHLSDVSHVIQLAVAPVFLLTAIATLINAMNTRLGRIVDRRRVVNERLLAQPDCPSAPSLQQEIHRLLRRSLTIYHAIFCAVLSALLVCVVVACAFIGALMQIDLARAVAIFFIIAMISMIAGLGLFLREIYWAVRDH
jgi:uncharacterized protein DUF2721